MASRQCEWAADGAIGAAEKRTRVRRWFVRSTFRKIVDGGKKRGL